MRLLALALLLHLGLVAAARAAQPLAIMVEDASEPFSRADGSGYANDLVRAAYKAAGVDVRLTVVPYARCKKSLEEGVTPACFSMSWAPEFKGRIVFSERPLFEVHADILANRGGRPIAGPQSLGLGSQVGIINGYEYPDAIYALARRGATLERNLDDDANIRMLAAGRLDAAVVMTSAFGDLSRRVEAAGATRSVRKAFRSGTLKSYIGFSLSNPRGAEARRDFDRGYAIIIADGARDRIRDRWLKLSRR